MKAWAQTRYKSGFTIVETVVVVTVVAILATITVVGYGAWREQIATDEVKNDLLAAASAMENASNFSSGYPSSLPSQYTSSQNVTLTYARGDKTSFCLNASSKQVDSVVYYYDSSAAKKEPKEGSCAGQLTTNLVTNPRPTDGAYYHASVAGELRFQKNSSGDPVVRSTRINSNQAYALYMGQSTGGIATAKAGDTYTALFTVVSSISSTMSVQAGYGSGGSYMTSQAISLTANVPYQVHWTFTVPSGYDNERLFLKAFWGTTTGTVGDYFEVSKVMLVPGAYAGSYADGDTSGWRWHGGVNSSTSSGVGSS